LIALELWTVVIAGFGQRLFAAMFGVGFVAVAFPVVVFSGAWIACAAGDYDSPSAAMPPPTQAQLETWRLHNRCTTADKTMGARAATL